MITNQKVAYYQGSEVRIVNHKHPHFNAVGNVLRGEQTPMGYGWSLSGSIPRKSFSYWMRTT